MSSQTNSSTLPQGFSVFQPALGAQLQFLPAIGTPQLDELLNAYIPGPASAQEKRASVSLDFLEYSHLTGQSFKFYAVHSIVTPVESPATVSPVMSSWDWSQASTSSRSPTSQKARTSPKAGSSRHQADFSHIPGMKIMTKDGLDVTNSASRGSKTKEQRDHAHLMRIIKACDSCKRKKIRCDPSHKKRGVSQTSQSHSQPAARVTKKVRTATQDVRVSAPAIVPQTDFSLSESPFAIDQSFAPVDLEMLTPVLPALEPWEEFIQYPTADLSADYDFFYDPEGYLSPDSSSSLSAFSTKPVTPNSQQDLSGSFNLSTDEATVASPQLPFNQTDSVHDYVDFNLFSPQSCFSEDDHMVPIEMSRQVASQSQSLQSDLLGSDQSPGRSGGDGGDGGLIRNVSDAALWSASPHLSGDEEKTRHDPYCDPGLGVEGCHSSSSSSLSSDVLDHSLSWIEETASMSTSSLEDNFQSDGDNVVLRNASVDSEALLVERVASSNVAYASQTVARGGSESRADSAGVLSTIGGSMITNVVVATPASLSVIAHSVAANDSYGSSDGQQVTSNGALLTAPRTADSSIVNTDIANAGTVNASTVNAGTVDADMEQSSVRRGTVAHATIIANARLQQSPVSRGTFAYATVIANSDATRQSLSEQSVITDAPTAHAITANATMANTERLTNSSRAQHGVRAVSSQASPDQDLSLSSVDAPRVDAQIYFAPPTSSAGGWDSMVALVSGATAALTSGSAISLVEQYLTSGSAKSLVEQYLTTMISVVLLLIAIAAWSHQSPKSSLRFSYGQMSSILIGKATPGGKLSGVTATLQDRLEALKSHASNGNMSVSRVVSRSTRLKAM
ncbi:hypothetical protein G7Z17_g5007 [Cylindrodendrum hubeiense]|uniref:Transcription factor Cys6 n=1 Tax=Cylindrodendrum hubeiense TaxID=595255 RepID=A0A9P5HCQ7_9HYPO|nr:hypothetical protein G7Z17_g5007 [Cylindrodendrum hubeiense]